MQRSDRQAVHAYEYRGDRVYPFGSLLFLWEELLAEPVPIDDEPRPDMPVAVINAWCKRFRNPSDAEWKDMDLFYSAFPDASTISRCICPSCLERDEWKQAL